MSTITKKRVNIVYSAGPQPVTELHLPETNYVAVGGGKIRVRMRPGDGTVTREDNVPIVMIHGIGRSLEDWDDQISVLDPALTCIAIDVPGFGFSDPSPAATVNDVAAMLWEVLDTLNVQRVNLVGNSLGGALSMHMAVQYPHRVASVGLVDAAGFGREVTPLLLTLWPPVMGWLNAWCTRLWPVYVLTEQLTLRRHSSVTPRRLAIQSAIVRHPHRTKAYHSLVRFLMAPWGIKKTLRRDLLDSFAQARSTSQHIPVFLAWGTKDLILPFKHFYAALEEVSPEHAVIFEGCGHMPQLEDPCAFARNYEQFLHNSCHDS